MGAEIFEGTLLIDFEKSGIKRIYLSECTEANLVSCGIRDKYHLIMPKVSPFEWRLEDQQKSLASDKYSVSNISFKRSINCNLECGRTESALARDLLDVLCDEFAPSETDEAGVIRLVYPGTKGFQYNSRDTVALRLGGKGFADFVFVGMKRYKIVIHATWMICSILAILYLLHLGEMPSGVNALSMVFWHTIPITFIFLFNWSILKMVLVRFEIQFALFNIVFILFYMSLIHEEHLHWAGLPALIWFVTTDASRRRNDYFRVFGFFTGLGILAVMCLANTPEYSGNDEVLVDIRILGRIRKTSINQRALSSVLNLALIGMKTIYTTIRYPNRFVTLKSQMVSSKVEKKVAALAIACSGSNLTKLENRFNKENLTLDPDLGTRLYRKAASGGPSVAGVLSGEKKYRVAVFSQPPFTFNTGDTIGRVFFGDTIANISLSKKATLFHILGSVPCWLYSLMLLRSKQSLDWTAVGSCVVISIGSGNVLLNLTYALVLRVFTNFDALFVFVNLLGLFVCGTLMFEGNQALVLLSWIPFIFTGTFCDAHPSRNVFRKIYIIIVLVSLIYILVGLFLGEFAVEEIEVHVGKFRISILDRSFGLLFNLVLMFSRQLYSLVKNPDHFLFIRTSLETQELSKTSINMMTVVDPSFIVGNAEAICAITKSSNKP